MTDEKPKALTMRVPSRDVRYDPRNDTYWITIENGEKFLEQMMVAYMNPDKAIVPRDKEEER